MFVDSIGLYHCSDVNDEVGNIQHFSRLNMLMKEDDLNNSKLCLLYS